MYKINPYIFNFLAAIKNQKKITGKKVQQYWLSALPHLQPGNSTRIPSLRNMMKHCYLLERFSPVPDTPRDSLQPSKGPRLDNDSSYYQALENIPIYNMISEYFFTLNTQ